MQLQQAELQEAGAKHGFAEARLRAICKTHEGPEALALAKVCEKTCSEDWEKHDTLLTAMLRRQAQIHARYFIHALEACMKTQAFLADKVVIDPPPGGVTISYTYIYIYICEDIPVGSWGSSRSWAQTEGLRANG